MGYLIALWNFETELTKLTLAQWLEPVSSWQELGLEKMEELGIQIERLTGRRRERVRDSWAFLAWDGKKRCSLSGSPVKREGHLFASWLFLSRRFSHPHLTPDSLLANRRIDFRPTFGICSQGGVMAGEMPSIYIAGLYISVDWGAVSKLTEKWQKTFVFIHYITYK